MEQKIKDLKEWVQHRIDYWEGVCEKHPMTNINLFEQGCDKGELSSYRRIQQHINTTFGEWVKSE